MDETVRTRVVVVADVVPFPPTSGAAMRVYQLCRELSREHSVTLISLASPEQRASQADLEVICDEVRLVPWRRLKRLRRRVHQLSALLSGTPYRVVERCTPEMQAAVTDCLTTRSALTGRPPDVVQVEGSALMQLRFPTSAPVVLDEHNVESEVLRRQQRGERTASRRRYQGVEARKQERFEDSAWRSAAAVAVTSEREVDVVAARASNRPVAVVPNGVDPEYFSPSAEPAAVDPDTIAFVGSMTYRPNLDGILYFVEEILPLIRRRRPAASLTVIGQWRRQDADLLDSTDAVVTGRVPDVRPYLARAACVVAPIRMGGGTRLKVLEALGMAKAMVSTTLGCEGLAVCAGQHLLVADEPQQFADEVCRLLEDPTLGRRLGTAGRALVESRYTWATAAASMTSLFNQCTSPTDRLADGHPPGSSGPR